MIQYRCPECGKTVFVTCREEAPSRPFCSRRCQLLDLGKWFDGAYVISDSLVPGADAIEGDEGSGGDASAE